MAELANVVNLSKAIEDEGKEVYQVKNRNACYQEQKKRVPG